MDSTAVRHVHLATAQKFVVLVAAAFAFLLLAGVFATPAHASVQDIRVCGTTIYQSGSATGKTVSGVSYSGNTLTLNNASLNYSSDVINISGLKTDTVNVVLKGSNSLKTTSSYGDGIDSSTKLSFSGSNLTMNSCYRGISSDAVVTIKSGTFNLWNCGYYGIESDGGINISGGKLNITTTGNGYALYSSDGKISNKAKNLGYILGGLSAGAEFKKGGSTYKLTSVFDAALKKYGGKKKAKIDEVSFGGQSYTIRGIAAKAFKTKKGAKVKSITVSNHVDTVGKLAFAGTKKLTKLDLSDAYYLTGTGSGSVINKKAFAKCGKAGGKKLKVKTGWTSKTYQKKSKKFLVKKGLSKKAKVVR